MIISVFQKNVISRNLKRNVLRAYCHKALRCFSYKILRTLKKHSHVCVCVCVRVCARVYTRVCARVCGCVCDIT